VPKPTGRFEVDPKGWTKQGRVNNGTDPLGKIEPLVKKFKNLSLQLFL